jgi:hypothetical protein
MKLLTFRLPSEERIATGLSGMDTQEREQDKNLGGGGNLPTPDHFGGVNRMVPAERLCYNPFPFPHGAVTP